MQAGTGRLVENHDEHPDDVVKAFLNHRGTTAAAIEAMRAKGFDATVAVGLAAAFEKSAIMGSASAQ